MKYYNKKEKEKIRESKNNAIWIKRNVNHLTITTTPGWVQHFRPYIIFVVLVPANQQCMAEYFIDPIPGQSNSKTSVLCIQTQSQRCGSRLEKFAGHNQAVCTVSAGSNPGQKEAVQLEEHRAHCGQLPIPFPALIK
ncbi:hypothetical protein GQX74_004582 [Glossina fuscipes]|nr:hypothetical protein GQX74_004582 [Glossina fuscipes]